jgi:hypothetical protein
VRPTTPPVSTDPGSPLPEPIAGVIGGLVAGTAYLVAQVSFTAAVRPGTATEPLLRIAAILLGPDAAEPSTEVTFSLIGMALIIHFALSMTYGRIVSFLAWRRRLGGGMVVGALVGVALYAVNFGLIAPSAFPWFSDSIRWLTLVNHALFGVVAAAVCLSLRARTAGSSSRVRPEGTRARPR